ncbi:hypothetical protein [Rhizobium sp. PAMB 3182]
MSDDTLFEDFNRLMLKAHRDRISDAQICRVAGCAPRYLWSLRAGERPVTRKLISRLQLAIGRIKRGDLDPAEAPIAATFRLVIAMVAANAEVAPEFILSADPARRATADPDWLKAAHLRRRALYICNVHLNIDQATLGRVAGMSKAAVSAGLKEFDEDDDMPAPLLSLLGTIGEAFAP